MLTLRTSIHWQSLLLGAVSCCLGCNQFTNPAGVPPPSSASRDTVRAQGQILPAGGFVRLAAAPGDIVDKINFKVGQEVKSGDELVLMRSAKLREKQIAALEAQRDAADEERELAIKQANQRVTVADEKLKNVAQREAALSRKDELIRLAVEQLNASESVLKKLESISQDQLTSEFVGKLEIDRQRISVGEANLKVEQQRESLAQARDELRYAREAAETEKRLAKEMLETAQNQNPLAAIDAQIEALKEEQKLARVTSPINGQIVAINVKEGEASAQLPIIEIADLSQMVCEVEVNEVDAARVLKGHSAVITSRAFQGDGLTGEVDVPRSPMVGRPTLRPLDPLARTDYRSVTSIIALDDDVAAKKWLQLHVQVEITPKGEAAKKSSAPATAGPDTEAAPAE